MIFSKAFYRTRPKSAHRTHSKAQNDLSAIYTLIDDDNQSKALKQINAQLDKSNKYSPILLRLKEIFYWH